MTPDDETAEMVFERINRRRAAAFARADAGQTELGPLPEEEVVSAPLPARPTGRPAVFPDREPGTAGTPPLRVDEILFERVPAVPVAAATTAADASDTFPRSATMRMVLKHPGLALGVGIPAAALLFRSQASRHLLYLALQAGTRPGVQDLIGLSAAAAARLARPGQKKAP